MFKTKRDIPIYAKIIKDNKLLAKAKNTRQRDSDIIGHAEINVLKKAAKKLGTWNLQGCEIWTTLEPCLMCIAAILDSKVDKLYYAAFDSKAGACGSVWNIPSDWRSKNNLQVYSNVEMDGLSPEEHSARIKLFFENTLRDKCPKTDYNKATYKIKSYVVRSGKTAEKYQKAYEKYKTKYLINSESLANLPDLFIKSDLSARPVLEIGSGQGATLNFLAQKNPQRLYIGSEVYFAGVAHTIYTANKAENDNIRIFYGDVLDLLSNLPDNFFSDILCFFPDPWHKRKHRKRRLINQEFLDLAGKKHIGEFRVATDNQDYKNALLSLGFRQTTRPEIRPITTFEKKALAAKRPVYDLIMVK
ncbi:MAG: hypothetical protein LBT85_04005 [Bifidobacteriaceae bacterium]|nr:hypothetical protein [Bifidobacteriaceae bacterium]